MKEIRDRFSGWAGTISLQDWKIWFMTWMREKRQRNTNFNNWYAFELLPQYLEHEALETYEQWTEAHWMELRQVGLYWGIWVELVSVLNEGVASSLMAVHGVKTEVPEGVYVVDMEGASLSQVHQAQCFLYLVMPGYSGGSSLLRNSATFWAITGIWAASTGPVWRFPSGSDAAQQDFRRENDDTPCTMYTRLTRLPENLEVCSQKISSESVFVKNWQTPRWFGVVHYHGVWWSGDTHRGIRCDRAVWSCIMLARCHWLGVFASGSSKPRRALVTIAGLAEAKTDNIYHYWTYGQPG